MNMLPTAVLAMPGAPARATVVAASGRQRPEQGPLVKDVPIGQREPPEHWPGWMKSWFKVGRGTATAIDGTVQLGKKAHEKPEKIPGALGNLAANTADDPIETIKALVGYDDLANGRYEDWLGQMGLAALTAGAGTLPARGSQLRRVVGSPKVVPVGQLPPRNAKFAGRRMDFRREDLGAPEGSRLPKMSEEQRAALAKDYPGGVRFTRAGYPVFTPYAIKRVDVEGLTGDRRKDARLANAAVGHDSTLAGHTWHHVENGRTMELVPEDLHDAARHTGGADAIKNDAVGRVAPGGVLTGGERTAAGVGAAAGAGTTATGAEAGRP
jgi:hypothetical protein